MADNELKPGQVVEYWNSHTRNTDYVNLRKRWDEDFRLWRLHPYDAGKDYYSYTSNAPRVLATKIVSLLSQGKVIIRVPDSTLKEEERRIASNNERLVYGAITLQNERNARVPDLQTVHDALCWYACLRGFEVLRPYVYNDNGKTVMDLAVWDIYDTAYSAGPNGLTWAVHIRTATADDIKQNYGVTVTGDTTTIYEYWDERNHAVAYSGGWLKEPTPHGLTYCPVFVLRSGLAPTISSLYETSTTHYSGESVFATNRGLYPILNKTLSDLLTIVRRGVTVPLGYWSAGGQETLDDDIWQVEKGKVIPMDSTTNENIKPLIEPTMPADANNLVNFIVGEVQRGGVSHVALGELGFRLSGYAINSLKDSLETTATPFIQLVERAYMLIAEELLSQFGRKTWKAVEVRGRTSRNQPFGMMQPVKLTPKDIEPEWHPEVKLMASFPKDDAQRLQMARLATEGPNPLMSMRSAREGYLGIEDLELEQEFTDNEWADALPVVRLRKAYLAAMNDGDTDKAQQVLAELMKYMMASGAAAAGGGARGPGAAIGAMSMENPGMGLPSQGTGMPASALPPESLGSAPGGAVNAKEV